MKLTEEALKRIIKEELDEGILDSIKSKLGFGDKAADEKAERLKMLNAHVNRPMSLFTTTGTMFRAYAAGMIFAHAEATAPEKVKEVKRAYTLLKARDPKEFEKGYQKYQQEFGENK
jgi:polyhydroxyalkanoate synthesis regulator protein